MTLIERLKLLFTFTIVICTLVCTLDSIFAGEFGITRRGINNSVKQSRNNPQVSVQSTISAKPAMPSNSAKFTIPAASSVSSLSSLSSSSELPVYNSQSDQPFPNIARLVAFDKKGQSFGSCSYIGSAGDYGVIISNWHVICESDGLVHVHFPSGFSSFGAIIQFDRKWDLAVIVISKPPLSIPPLPIMQTAPRPGEPLWIAGYGAGSYRIASGYCVEYLAPEIPRNGTAPSYEIIKLSTTARQGDSGGPILNKNGELAGVLFGSDMVTSTAGSHCVRVKWFLKQVNPIIANLPIKPEAFFASIEPTGPRHSLNGSQQNKRTDSILQAKNTHSTMPIKIPTENSILTPINKHKQNYNYNYKQNQDNLQNSINNTNNNKNINDKENSSTNNIYNKSAQKDQLQDKTTQSGIPEKYVEKRPLIADEKPPSEKYQTVEWIYDLNETKSESNIVTKNNTVIPIANFQAVDEKNESKVTMAILHLAENSKQILEKTLNQTNNSNQTGNNEKTTLSDINLVNSKLQSPMQHIDYSRKYFVLSVAVIFSLLIYLSLRFLKTSDNEKLLSDSTKSELAAIKININQDNNNNNNNNNDNNNDNVIKSLETSKSNNLPFSQKSKHNRKRSKAA
ncbi:MAG: serine protease [Planctomycetaceae bacterium]|jgi:S1-C subfamily serine protease|nr:serine protease [Planctomycetaceae bacterium]